MSKIKKRNITIGGILLILLLCASLFATLDGVGISASADSLPSVPSLEYTEASAFQFTVINTADGSKKCSVKLVDKTLSKVYVPKTATIDGIKYTVTEVVSSGFASTPALVRVILPSSIEKINATAFQNCANLEIAYAPNVKNIGMAAFAMCPKLGDFIFPQTLQTVASSVFLGSSTKVHARFSASQSGWVSNWNSGNAIQSVDYYERDANGVPWLHDLQYDEVQSANPLTRTGPIMRLAPFQPRSESINQGPLVLDANVSMGAYPGGTFSHVELNTGVTSVNIESMAFMNITVLQGFELTCPVTYNHYGTTSTMPFCAVNTPSFKLPIPQKITDGMFFQTTASNINFIGTTQEGSGVVRIPDSITEIGSTAFYQTNNISTLHLSPDTTSIGSEAFYGWNENQTIHTSFFSQNHADYVVDNTTWRSDCEASITYVPVEFDNQGGSGLFGVKVEEGNISSTITKPTKNNAIFDGYYTGENGAGTMYYSATGERVNNWTSSVEILYANWSPNGITFDDNGGTGGPGFIAVNYGEKWPTQVQVPTGVGNFYGYYYNYNSPTMTAYQIYDSTGKCVADKSVFGSANYYIRDGITLKAVWEYFEYTLVVDKIHATELIPHTIEYLPWFSGGASYSCTADASMSYTNSTTGVTETKNFTEWVVGIGGYTNDWRTYSTNRTITITATQIKSIFSNLKNGDYITVRANYKTTPSTCVAEGTLVTLADGSQKAVELLTIDDQLLVWNHHTGSFDIAPITFIDSNPLAEYDIINLNFSDGTNVKVSYEHAFWNFDLNRYVMIREGEAEQYIGHWFNKQITDAEGNMAWTRVQLVSVENTVEYTTVYSPVTFGHLNFYVNGLLSMPGDTDGLINIFEVDADTLQYDQEAFLADIAEYGMFDYADFADMIPEEIFEAFQVQYLTVSLGKGLITWERIEVLVGQFAEYWA